MNTLFQVLSLVFLAVILFSLFRALVMMVANKSASGATVKALSWRISLSVTLFLLLMLLRFFYIQ